MKKETVNCDDYDCACKKTVDNHTKLDYKYSEDKILSALKDRIDASYHAHYSLDDTDLQTFDIWFALGGVTETARNIAFKYLWRYGQKNGSDPEDLFKAMHFIMLMLYAGHYKE